MGGNNPTGRDAFNMSTAVWEHRSFNYVKNSLLIAFRENYSNYDVEC